MQLNRLAMPVIGIVVCSVVACLQAQEKRASPHETVTGTIDGGGKITIEYGRPYVKGRQIWGGLNPWGQVWRLGADESTTMTTSMPVTIGGLAVPAGKHSLYMWVDENQPKLIVNKQTGQWGTEYDGAQDLGRVTLEKKMVPKVEQLTLAVTSNPGGGVLKITWDDREYSAAIK